MAQDRSVAVTSSERVLSADRTRAVTPTVESAAAAASISRATAYRYFSNQDALLVAAHPEIHVGSVLDADAPTEPEARLDVLVTRTSEIFLRSEATYRTMLRLSLETDPAARGDLALRKGLRLRWIEDGLEPVRSQLRGDEFRRLSHAIAATIGIEAIVVLVDLLGLSRAEAVDVTRWSARALLREALADPPETATA